MVQLLKLFNGNTETPLLLWDNSTRAELTDYIEDQQELIIKSVVRHAPLSALSFHFLLDFCFSVLLPCTCNPLRPGRPRPQVWDRV